MPHDILCNIPAVCTQQCKDMYPLEEANYLVFGVELSACAGCLEGFCPFQKLITV